MFEAIKYGMAIVTYDYPPYNEVVPRSCYNRHIDARQITMMDNSDSIIKACDFMARDLDSAVREMIETSAKRPPIKTSIVSHSAVEKRFMKGCTF